MADKKSAAARKKHDVRKASAKAGKPEKLAAPAPKKLATLSAKAEAPAAKVKRGEKERAPKQAKKAGKGGDEEAGPEEAVEGDEPELEAAVPVSAVKGDRYAAAAFKYIDR